MARGGNLAQQQGKRPRAGAASELLQLLLIAGAGFLVLFAVSELMAPGAWGPAEYIDQHGARAASRPRLAAAAGVTRVDMSASRVRSKYIRSVGAPAGFPPSTARARLRR